MRSRIAVAFTLGLLVAPIAGAQFRRGGYFGRQAQYAAPRDLPLPVHQLAADRLSSSNR
jgi:hypothetical protein